MKLYDYLPSGNGYKVRLLLSWLGQEYQYEEVNIHAGETHSPEFLAFNPSGQIPVLDLGDGRHLAESNAILFYLALGTKYLPPDAFSQAEILRWMFFEQYKHEPAIAVARFIKAYAPEREAELPNLMKRGYIALDIMEAHLKTRGVFVGDNLSIADISLYGYTHVADAGGFEMKPYKAIKKWMKRVKDHPNYLKITTTPN